MQKVASALLCVALASQSLASNQNERERERVKPTKSSTKSSSKSKSTKKSNSTKAQKRDSKSHGKNGVFAGVELGFGLANAFISNDEKILLSKQNYATLPLNFAFGYQWYFAHDMGMRAKGYIGISSYSNEIDKSR